MHWLVESTRDGDDVTDSGKLDKILTCIMTTAVLIMMIMMMMMMIYIIHHCIQHGASLWLHAIYFWLGYL